jgi:16S rRNA (adenine1518-N6/adenine1519-N6)-dimethyltransferase
MAQSPRSPQTVTQIRELLANVGQTPNKRLGQHFLINGNLMNTLVNAAAIESSQVVLEVGCGTGSLTALLAEEAHRVIAVEYDQVLLDIASQCVDLGNIDWIAADVLNGPRQLSPAVGRTLAAMGERDWALVANLPYGIASPLIVILLEFDPAPKSMTFTVQSEVADRISASPGRRSYGPLSVLVQCMAEVIRLRKAPASAFWPQPNVESTMMRLIPKPLVLTPGERESLQWIVKTLFSSRRKMMRSILKHSKTSPSRLDSLRLLLADADIDLSLRAESLTVDQFLGVAKKLAQAGSLNIESPRRRE